MNQFITNVIRSHSNGFIKNQPIEDISETLKNACKSVRYNMKLKQFKKKINIADWKVVYKERYCIVFQADIPGYADVINTSDLPDDKILKINTKKYGCSAFYEVQNIQGSYYPFSQMAFLMNTKEFNWYLADLTPGESCFVTDRFLTTKSIREAGPFPRKLKAKEALERGFVRVKIVK